MSATIYLQYPGKDEAVAVATGFSWGACLLGFIWALSKRMWFAAFVMLAINLILLGIGLWSETGTSSPDGIRRSTGSAATVPASTTTLTVTIQLPPWVGP